MTYPIYPKLPGEAWSPKIAPKFSTIVKRSASLRRYALSQAAYPMYDIEVPYNYLTAADYATLRGFFEQMRGPATPFYYAALNDSTADQFLFATGDGATLAYQIMQGQGALLIPVYGTFGSPVVYTNGAIENRFAYSGDLSNAAWSTYGVTVSSSITLAGHTLWTVTGDGGNSRNVFQITPGTTPAGGYVTLRAICSAGTSTQTAVRLDNNNADGTSRFFRQVIDWAAGIPSLSGSTTAGGFDMYGTPQLNDLGGGVYEVILAAVNNSGAAQACRAILYEQWASGSGSSETAYWGEAQVEFSDSFSAYLETLATPYTWSIGNTGLVTFSVAPPAGATIKWSGNYYYLCAFSQDTQTFEQFLDQLFKADVVKLETVTP